MDQQDFSIYTKLYELLFSSTNQTTEIPVVEEQEIEDVNAPPPIVPIMTQEKEKEEEEVLVFTPTPQPVESESEKQLKEQQGRAQSRVKDVVFNYSYYSLVPCYST